MTPAELPPHIEAAWQRQRAHVAKRSRFYRRLWNATPPPENLRDLPALPLSDKAQLRASQAEHPPFGDYLAAPRQEEVRLHRTSGTTGQAMNLALSVRDCAVTQEVGGRSHRAAGLTPDHTVVHCLNYQMWMGGVTDHMTLEATGALVVPFGVGATERLIRTIREVGIDTISCTPSYPAVLERVLAERFPGIAPRDLGLKLGLFGGESGLDDLAFRGRLAETWGMEPRNANYGVSDVFSNFAAQCEHDIPFDKVISVAEANTFKPHRAAYLKAAEICGVGPKEILFVASHTFDCIGAKAARMRTAFINRRQRPFERTPYQPDMTFRTMSELADAMV